MRPLLHGDLVAAARALLAVPAAGRDAAMASMLAAADRADRYRKSFGRAHPRHGTGSLMAAAGAWQQPPEPGLDDADYIACLLCALAAIQGRREHAARAPTGVRAASDLSSGPDR